MGKTLITHARVPQLGCDLGVKQEGYFVLGNCALTRLQKATLATHPRSLSGARRCYTVGAPGPHGRASAAADLREPRSLPTVECPARVGLVGREQKCKIPGHHFPRGQLNGGCLGCQKLTGQC